MILNIDGEINNSYVQNLCLIFFPGAKFSPSEEPDDDTAKVDLSIAQTDSGCYAKVKMSIGEKSATSEYFSEYNELFTIEKTVKLAAGTAKGSWVWSISAFRRRPIRNWLTSCLHRCSSATRRSKRCPSASPSSTVFTRSSGTT